MPDRDFRSAITPTEHRRAQPLREADDIKSLRHGIEALRMAASRGTVSTTEVATACGVSRPAGYRLLQTLQREGYLAAQGTGRQIRYRLTLRVRELSHGYEGGVLVLDAAIPIMIEWTRENGWPLALSTPAGDHSICRFATDPTAARALIRYRAGVTMTALMSASAMVCLAYQSAAIQTEAIRRMIGAPLPAYARARSSADIATLLQQTRRNGYAAFYPDGLREASLAVPVWLDGALSASLAMRFMLVAAGGSSGHAQRLRILRGLCERITSRAEVLLHA